MESTATVRMRNYGDLITKGINNERALQLQKISRQLHTLDEASCNWGLTPRQEKREENLEAKAELIAGEHGLKAYHQGDPRGWSLYLLKPEETDYSQGIAVCPH